MTRDELQNYLPHRDRMLLVDEAYLNGDGTATGYYTVRGDEFFLQGHFPGYPVTPGVILCEILAQVSCVLMIDEMRGKRPFFAGMTNVKFRNMVHPGDKVEVHSQIVKILRPLYHIKGTVTVGGKLCMQGEFSFVLKPAGQAGIVS